MYIFILEPRALKYDKFCDYTVYTFVYILYTYCVLFTFTLISPNCISGVVWTSGDPHSLSLPKYNGVL